MQALCLILLLWPPITDFISKGCSKRVFLEMLSTPHRNNSSINGGVNLYGKVNGVGCTKNPIELDRLEICSARSSLNFHSSLCFRIVFALLSDLTEYVTGFCRIDFPLLFSCIFFFSSWPKFLMFHALYIEIFLFQSIKEQKERKERMDWRTKATYGTPIPRPWLVIIHVSSLMNSVKNRLDLISLMQGYRWLT